MTLEKLHHLVLLDKLKKGVSKLLLHEYIVIDFMFNTYTEPGPPINLTAVSSQSDCTVVRLSWTIPEPNGKTVHSS